MASRSGAHSNNLYVTAEPGYTGLDYGMLRAASTAQPPNTAGDVKFYRPAA